MVKWRRTRTLQTIAASMAAVTFKPEQQLQIMPTSDERSNWQSQTINVLAYWPSFVHASSCCIGTELPTMGMMRTKDRKNPT